MAGSLSVSMATPHATSGEPYARIFLSIRISVGSQLRVKTAVRFEPLNFVDTFRMSIYPGRELSSGLWTVTPGLQTGGGMGVGVSVAVAVASGVKVRVGVRVGVSVGRLVYVGNGVGVGT